MKDVIQMVVICEDNHDRQWTIEKAGTALAYYEEVKRPDERTLCISDCILVHFFTSAEFNRGESQGCGNILFWGTDYLNIVDRYVDSQILKILKGGRT